MTPRKATRRCPVSMTVGGKYYRKDKKKDEEELHLKPKLSMFCAKYIRITSTFDENIINDIFWKIIKMH